MVYTERKIKAYYSNLELIVLAIIFLLSFSSVLLVGIIADRSSFVGILLIAITVSMSICGGIEGIMILKLTNTSSGTLGKFMVLILIAVPVFIAGVFIFLPHYFYSLWANVRG